jgi:hypothetical protein
MTINTNKRRRRKRKCERRSVIIKRVRPHMLLIGGDCWEDPETDGRIIMKLPNGVCRPIRPKTDQGALEWIKQNQPLPTEFLLA